MQKTIDISKSHAAYEKSSIGMQKAIDFAYDKAIEVLQIHGFNTYNDDRAEELVAAITHYVISCNSEVL